MALIVTSKFLPFQSLHVQPSLKDIDVLEKKLSYPFLPLLWLHFLTTFQGNTVFQISHRKVWLFPDSWGCFHRLSVDATAPWKELSSGTMLTDWSSIKKYQLRLHCIYRGGFGLHGRPLRKWSKQGCLATSFSTDSDQECFWLQSTSLACIPVLLFLSSNG